MVYKARIGKKLNIKNPVTYNEKIQWLKLYDRNPEYIRLVDKYEVRKYVEDKIGSQYLIPLLGVYNSFDEIDFEQLPDQFILKCTHDCGGNIICKNKNELDKRKAKRFIHRRLKRNYFYPGREWAYKYVKPRIVCEELLL